MTTEPAILQTQTIADSTSGWSVPLSFNQFDPSLGILSDVDVGIVGDVTGTAAIQNLGATAASLQIDLPSTIDVAAPDGTVLASVSPEASTTLNLGAYDGTDHFTGISGTVVSGFSSVATAVSDYIPSPGTGAAFVGTGSIDLTASGQVSSRLYADGNLLSLTQGEAGVTVSVQYNYQAPSEDSDSSSTTSLLAGSNSGSYISGGPGVIQTTVPQTLAVSDRTTDWHTIVTANQFNPALGELMSVNLTVTGDINAGLAAENLGSTSASIGLTETADITLTLPNGLGVATADPSINSDTVLGAFDGTIDFAGASGETLTGLTGSDRTWSQVTGDLSSFIGTGTVALPIAADSPSILTGPADLAAELLTDAGATVTISYTYFVPDGSEPSPQQFSLPILGATAPVISGAEAGQAVTSQATIAPFSTVLISDPKAGQTESVTVTLSSAANGTLTNLGGGSYDAASGVYSDSGSAAAVTATVDGLVFNPTPGQVAPGQTVTTGFTITDMNTAGGRTTDTTTSVVARSLAEPLVISGTEAGQGVTDQTTVAPFANVLMTDPNAAQTETVTVTQSAAGNGTLSQFDGGSYNAVTGVYTVTGSAAAVTAALDGLVFTPAEVAPCQTVATGFTITDTNTAGLSVTDTTTSVTATAGVYIDTAAAAAAIVAELDGLANPPTIAGTKTSQAVTDHATIAPFSGVIIGDTSSNQTESVTVTLSGAANGTLSNLGGGHYNAMTGVYTDSGSAAAVTAALDGLVFKPTMGQVAPDQTVTTNFTIADTDTAGARATDTASSVISTASIGITGTAPNGFIHGGSGTSQPFSGDTISDVFSAPWSQSGGGATLPWLAFSDFSLNLGSNQGSGFSGSFASHSGAYPIMSQFTDTGLTGGHPFGS